MVLEEHEEEEEDEDEDDDNVKADEGKVRYIGGVVLESNPCRVQECLRLRCGQSIS